MIRVGITELHGIAQEICSFPPDGVIYSELRPKRRITDNIFTSRAKGVLKYFDGSDVDIVEAPIFPVLTHQKWIYTPADFPTCLNYEICNIPTPRSVRIILFKHIIKKNNFKKLIFKSIAGRNTMYDYMKCCDNDLLSKIDVVYPAVRRVSDELIRYNTDIVNILYVGEFLSKGGMHVVDAFEELLKQYNYIRLRVCSSDKFNTQNTELENKYKEKLLRNPQIEFGLVERDKLLNVILPNSDIFICPTYKDSYGYAIEEAMAFGLPIISTNHFAIPEIVEHGVNGFLIETSGFEFIDKFRDYTVNNLPKKFHDHMNTEVYKYLKMLICDTALRKNMGYASLDIARSKFSFETRNKRMSEIYQAALDD